MNVQYAWSVIHKWLWEADKLQHIIVSLILLQLAARWVPIVIGVVIALLVGAVKEVWDLKYGSGFSWGDIWANVTGVSLGVALLLVQ